MAAPTETIRIIIHGLRIPAERSGELPRAVAQRLGVGRADIRSLSILRRSTDARQRRIEHVYALVAEVRVAPAQKKHILGMKDVSLYHPPEPVAIRRDLSPKQRIIIIGCGPAGLSAALILAERGARPIVIERGGRIDERVRKVSRFWKQGLLDSETNVVFGEGGAGTFSDGKLTSRSTSPLKRSVLTALVAAGAPEDILFVNRPHLGTDRLRSIIPRLVAKLENAGVTFMFNTAVTDIVVDNRRIAGVMAGGGFIPAEYVFLATGHSARDMYACLERVPVRMTPKGCAVGVRIEHPREFIDRARHGGRCGSSGIGAADYFYAFKDSVTGRGVYTFCMCPGGQVIGCASAPGELCTNGMSVFDRSSCWSNAAVVVTVAPADYAGSEPQAAIAFQRSLEQAVYALGKGSYHAPAERARDFVACRAKPRAVDRTSYAPGVLTADLHRLLPDIIAQPLRRGLEDFDRRMPGFIDEGVLIAAETRTSAPVRIERSAHNLHAAGVFGLIPAGEGAGHAGGIVSSAVDGMLAAMRFDS